MKRVVVTGSLAFDAIMDFPGRFADHILPDKIHILNLSFTLKTLKRQYGGTAGNIAYNLSLLGERPLLLGAAGGDFGDYRQHLRRVGVDVSKIKIYENLATASFFVITDLADNQIGGFYPGPMARKMAIDREDLKKASLVVVAANNPALMLQYARDCRRVGVGFIFDPAQQVIRLSRNDLLMGMKGARVLIGNDYEMTLIQKKTSLTREKLLELVEVLVTTWGEKGSLIETRNRRWVIPPAKPRKVLDPTGAGDAYRAGLVKGRLAGWPWEKAGRVASLAAVYAVEEYGTQKHHYAWSDFCRRYKDNFGAAL